ncbi:hypothetical protein BDZ94DRAFT_1268964 [Collybia nuda]|uniref:Uncharacterized protein n=1 Tax=Collybia nuda TaxID=64659 RepID=A0A9P6CEH8_9AGAR|nr:hypothetical protein BDZ94DRAFT_1268964 [Collybia nuda]
MSTQSLLQPLVETHISNQPVNSSPADPNSLMDLPVPNWITPKRVLYYGFNITESWLLKYTETHWKENYPTCDIKESNRLYRVFAGLCMIRRASGFRRIALKSARPNDRAIAEDTFVMNAEPERIVPVLSMCSTFERSYYNRPTKEQFDRLVEIVGKEPEWWIQHKPGDIF